jgi:hypothetical protein
MAVTDPTPDTTTVARALDADPDNLALFVDNHPDPDPSVAVVLSAAVVGRDAEEIGADTRDTVAAWVSQQCQRWPGPRDEILRYLDRHGPATEHEVVRALEPVENRRHVRPTLARLVREDVVGREDRDDEAALFSL